MRNIIKKILREEFPSKANKQKKLEYVQARFEILEKLYPNIEKYIETKFGNKVSMNGSVRDAYLGSDSLNIQQIYLEFFINERGKFKAEEIKDEIWKDLENIFNIDVSSYGEPIRVSFYKINWDQI